MSDEVFPFGVAVFDEAADDATAAVTRCSSWAAAACAAGVVLVSRM